MKFEPMNKCKFDEAWIGRCNALCLGESEYCIKHSEMKCVITKKQATHTCAYAAQFVCGRPLCDDYHECPGHT